MPKRPLYPTPTSTTPDDDGDGQSNAAELVAGTHPQNSQDKFSITNILRPASNSVKIEWPQVSGRKYRVQANTNLTSTNWTALATNLSTNSFTESSVTGTARFYRVVVETNSP